MHKLTEINIVPIKPKNGLVAFASLVFDDALYIGSIGIYTRPHGSYRLTYPTRVINGQSLNIFYPINRNTAQSIEKSIISAYEDVVKGTNDRHHSINHA